VPESHTEQSSRPVWRNLSITVVLIALLASLAANVLLAHSFREEADASTVAANTASREMRSLRDSALSSNIQLLSLRSLEPTGPVQIGIHLARIVEVAPEEQTITFDWVGSNGSAITNESDQRQTMQLFRMNTGIYVQGEYQPDGPPQTKTIPRRLDADVFFDEIGSSGAPGEEYLDSYWWVCGFLGENYFMQMTQAPNGASEGPALINE
jgi:type II secretory pathway pseudopilin PulG